MQKNIRINEYEICASMGGNGDCLVPVFEFVLENSLCDAPKPGCPLITRQPAEYSWMSGNLTPLTKIGQSLLCTGSSTQNTTCPKQFTMTTPGLHASKIMATWPLY